MMTHAARIDPTQNQTPPRAEPAPARSENTLTTSKGIRSFTLIALSILVLTLCVVVAVPFLPALTWSIALAIIAWPMHRRLNRVIGNPKLAAAISTAIVVVVIGGGAAFVTYQLAVETGAAANRLQVTHGDKNVREALDEMPRVSRVLAWMDTIGVDIETEVRNLISINAAGLGGFAHGTMAAGVQCLVAIFMLYYFFLDRAAFLHGLRDLLPLSRDECDRVIASAADSVHANLYATLVTSVIDTIGGGLMFWFLGVPAPIIWAAAMFILSLLPILGAGLVWFPAAIYLILSGHSLAAAALLAWGFGSFIVVDNFLYARLASDKMRLHPVPAMIAFLGGIAIFGMSGMILGPAILAVALAVLDVWKDRLQPAPAPIIKPT